MKNKVREFRLKAGLKQEELAEIAGVGRTVISQLENGTRDVITTDTMFKLAKALNTDAKNIFLP